MRARSKRRAQSRACDTVIVLTALSRYSFPPRARAVEWIAGILSIIMLLQLHAMCFNTELVVAATCLAQAAHEPRTLFVVGTYTIGKEVRSPLLICLSAFIPNRVQECFLEPARRLNCKASFV
jgi:hypothetical protein